MTGDNLLIFNVDFAPAISAYSNKKVPSFHITFIIKLLGKVKFNFVGSCVELDTRRHRLGNSKDKNR